MLTESQRAAILELHHQGLGQRRIARTLGIARLSVKKVIRSQSLTRPAIERPSIVEPYREEIVELYPRCKGNLVRVHEELQALGAGISYAALTAWCRREGIGQEPKVPVGRYHFDPGAEIQHDTSPHTVLIGDRRRKVQTAAAVLCHSRMIFVQCYPRFRRFECKIFLTAALKYFDGAPAVVMIDNTHVVVLQGTGASMVVVPEMVVFGERFGLIFLAHEVRDADRKAQVERLFWFFETNFLAGREFADWKDLNQQAQQWCDRNNHTHKRHLHAKPVELYARERLHLRPLPDWIPEPERLHHRIVDVEGYVAVETNRYSVPVAWIGRQVQIRESAETIRIELDRAPAVMHERVIDPCGKRATLPEHRPPRGQRRKRRGPAPEERTLSQLAPELSDYVADLKKKGRKQTTLALRQLLRMVREYPREPVRRAIREAAHYGLYDLDRVERIVLRYIGGDFFELLPEPDPDPDTEPDKGQDTGQEANRD
jgi:transposase